MAHRKVGYKGFHFTTLSTGKGQRPRTSRDRDVGVSEHGETITGYFWRGDEEFCVDRFRLSPAFKVKKRSEDSLDELR